jgi:hypothetical protein
MHLVVPSDGWVQVVAILSAALNIRAEQITLDSKLYADLGMEYGLQ